MSILNEKLMNLLQKLREVVFMLSCVCVVKFTLRLLLVLTLISANVVFAADATESTSCGGLIEEALFRLIILPILAIFSALGPLVPLGIILLIIIFILFGIWKIKLYWLFGLKKRFSS